MINIICRLSLIFMALAWHFPGTIACSILSWLGCLCLAISLEKVTSPYKILYSSGVFLYAIGFYWLFYTIRDFGGFGNFFSFLIFLLFITVSALQFLVFVFVWKNLPGVLHKNHLAIAAAWFVSEILSIRIFPWYLGHSQLAYTYFSQIADIGGAVPISFLMLYFSGSLSDYLKNKRINPKLLIAISLFIAINLYGAYRVNQFSKTDFPKVDTVLVQANISLEEKHNTLLPLANLERYIELSKPFSDKGKFIIWPESVLTEFIYAGLRNAADEPSRRLPYFENSSLLMGLLSYESREKIFNSAFGISYNGKISGVYHKQVLMPFGEYTPFSKTFPWLKDINGTAGEFSAGESIKVFEMNVNENSSVKVSPLICYEDVIPDLARKATLAGAEILVNITNDAWFGDTIAPYEHNLIASFRAIENRRYLLRSTNTGLTAIINPLGKIVGSIKPYSEGTLEQQVDKISFKAPSYYLNFELILITLAFLILFISITNFITQRKNAIN